MSYPYRNLLSTMLDAHATSWLQVHGEKIAASFGESVDERAAAFATLSVIDLSPLPRIGLAGVDIGSTSLLTDYALGNAANMAIPQDNGHLAIQLAADELILLVDPTSASPTPLPAITTPSYTCHSLSLADSHGWLAVTGKHAVSLLAKLTRSNLTTSGLVDNAVVATQLAGMQTLVIRHDIAGHTVFYLLSGNATLRYLWQCLDDAMTEFDGRVLGLQALQCD